MKTPITITKTIVSILESKAQYITQNIGSIVESTSLQTEYRQRRNFYFAWNNNRKAFSIAHYLSFYIYTIRWRPHDVIYHDVYYH